MACAHNAQEVGEHASCGPGNLPESGFTYNPETFMAGGIGYYNFSWQDMGVPNLDRMMDIVQVEWRGVQMGGFADLVSSKDSRRPTPAMGQQWHGPCWHGSLQLQPGARARCPLLTSGAVGGRRRLWTT